MHVSASFSSVTTPTLDGFAWGILRRKAEDLIGRAGFREQDREDLVQELALRLWKSLPDFDPNKAHYKSFVTTVVERSAINVLRFQRAPMRNRSAVSSLEQLIEANGESELTELAVDHELQAHHDLEMDVQECLEKLPEELRDLALRLQEKSLTQIARETEVARSTLQRRRDRLRVHLQATVSEKS